MSVPYELTGRHRQKARTRLALVQAARRLLADGVEPAVEDAAAAAGISRTTAYRYFPNQHALLSAAHPEIDRSTLLPPDPPEDAAQRLELVMAAFTRLTLDWEPQLRASLRLSLQPGADQPALRGGRAVAWIQDALAPLQRTHPGLDVHRLAVAIRSATGIESLVWLTDIAGQTRAQAAQTMCWTAHAMLTAALDQHPSRPRPPRGP
ncbi:TetR/AcrR family transcriptional regulator [Actinomadura parmotrematis]|uniref:TetR family transcriptional regulator n=1 Tax=Actinomadura parmotrematis TaxID=2864039 RepID=A0ABS7FRA5_9ACTN|nr:TetR family transcriptional regulator [Actinomadura parmotrematis]MBW8482755.1 TetR family transcriptional regulator [Actinomadura parmotrematis]